MARAAYRRLIYMLDQNTNRRFLVETGASYSILPYHSSLPAKGAKLFGPAGQLIPFWGFWGEHLVQLHFQSMNM
jgi:hypothetical protein